MANRIYSDYLQQGAAKHIGNSERATERLKELGWTFVTAPEHNVGKSVKPIVEWIDQKCEGHYMMVTLRKDVAREGLTCVMAFELPQDAMAVKLRWA